METGLKKKRERYYTNISTLFNLREIMLNREVVFMDRLENWKCIRGLFVKSVDGLKGHFYNFDFFNRDYNIYISRTKYKDIPLFTLNLKERSKHTSEWFKNDAKSSSYGFDLLLDFDSEKITNFNKMRNELIFIIDLFLKNNVCFKVFPSGNNFQVILPSDSIVLEKKEEQINFQVNLRDRFNLKYLCIRGQNVEIYKCSYSLSNDKVILPFRNSNFLVDTIGKFTYEDVDSNTVLRTINLYKRGECLINDFGVLENQENFKKFCKKYLL